MIEMHLKINHIHIWQWELNAPLEQIAYWESLLDPAELKRARRFHQLQHQHQFIISRGAVKRILAQYLNCQPTEITFAYSDMGKPFLVNNTIEFNLSHSGDLAVLAIAHAEIGIDIEKISDKDLMPIATRFFSPAEKEALIALPATQRQINLYGLWSKKEAILKACGKGLSGALAEFSILPLQISQIAIHFDHKLWHLRMLDLNPCYAATVASAFEPETIHFYHLNSLI